ncbi:HD domain-containing protein, partial [Salmonella enterica subsp. enterica serovar Kentucky]|nr:HD domain-containing protein [Salmonella enterica subsp. enterica serovar Kentucky]
RKMIMAMVQDIRVILIKLADRTHNMRTLGSLRPDKRRRIARDTPLSNQGRPCSRYVSSQYTASSPNGTNRSLLPLPITRTTPC